MGFILDIFGAGPASKNAKLQANATRDAAALQSKNDTLLAQAAEQGRETMLAQSKATQQAAELLSKPQGKVDVQLAPDQAPAQIDETTGRRKTTRSNFTYAKSQSSISI